MGGGVSRILVQVGVHNEESVIPILSLCHGIFTHRFIFRFDFSEKM